MNIQIEILSLEDTNVIDIANFYERYYGIWLNEIDDETWAASIVRFELDFMNQVDELYSTGDFGAWIFLEARKRLFEVVRDKVLLQKEFDLMNEDKVKFFY